MPHYNVMPIVMAQCLGLIITVSLWEPLAILFSIPVHPKTRLQIFLQSKLNSLSVGSRLGIEWLAEVRLWKWRVC